MPYKPKYCCQCGEKIDRIDWQPWTSRRFCELCETELGVYDWIPRGLFAVAFLFGLFGLGSYFQKSEKPLNAAPNQLVSRVQNTKSESVNQKIAPINNDAVQSSARTDNRALPIKSQTAPMRSDLKAERTVTPPNESLEKVYFCGAETKKGTMCSRRVKNGGRCWQHAGQPALLPQEKLIAVRQ